MFFRGFLMRSIPISMMYRVMMHRTMVDRMVMVDHPTMMHRVMYRMMSDWMMRRRHLRHHSPGYGQ